jgi:hypothetical protein
LSDYLDNSGSNHKDLNTFASAYSGSSLIGDNGATEIHAGNVGVLRGVMMSMSPLATRGWGLLLVSGRPLHEPIAWGGPIIMIAEEGLNRTFLGIMNGTFIRMTKCPQIRSTLMGHHFQNGFILREIMQMIMSGKTRRDIAGVTGMASDMMEKSIGVLVHG